MRKYAVVVSALLGLSLSASACSSCVEDKKEETENQQSAATAGSHKGPSRFAKPFVPGQGTPQAIPSAATNDQ